MEMSDGVEKGNPLAVSNHEILHPHPILLAYSLIEAVVQTARSMMRAVELASDTRTNLAGACRRLVERATWRLVPVSAFKGEIVSCSCP